MILEKLKIEYIAPQDLKAYANNVKIHTAEQIEQIKKSIAEFGMNDPIAIWHDNEIIEGHGRLLACLELGLENVPVIRLDALTDEQRRAYMLVHNKLTMATEFDFYALNDELEALAGIDMSAFGFELTEDDFSDIVSERGESERTSPDEDEQEETEYTTYAVNVICENEAEQVALYNQLIADGFNARLSRS